MLDALRALFYAALKGLSVSFEKLLSIITRVLGIVLAALAVQYVLNGVTQYYALLVHQEGRGP